VVDAVRCADDVQRGMFERNLAVAPDQRLEFRMGINVGDIIIDGDDIFGDGVNVAARLQTLAEPGGICVSRVVRDQVLDKLSFAFEDLGLQDVKNIARPVEAYRVHLGSAAPQTSSRGRPRRLMRTLGWRWLTAGVIALGIVGIALLTLPQFWKTAVPGPTPLPYSIAILPFAAAGGSPADDQFADALTNDLTMVLGKGRAARVVSQSLARTYKGKAIDARAVGRELNVLYLVEGEVRRAGERIIVSASVIEAGNASQLWSDRLDVDPAQTTQETGSLVALLTERVRNIVNAAELRRASAPLQPGANATDLTSHAFAMYDKDPNSLTTVLEARKLFDQALRLDPNLVFAMNGRGATLSGQLAMDLHADHDRLVQGLDEVSTRAVNVDPNNAYTWGLRSEALAWQWRWEAALEANAKATRLQPFNPWLLTQQAKLMLNTGHPTEALAQMDKALALQPQNNQALGYALLIRCCAYQTLGRYDDAIAVCEKSVAQDDWWLGHAYLVAAYAQKGETAKAEAEKITLLKQQPGFSIADLKAQRVSNDPTYLRQTETHLYAGLRKAGIPEN
jgi:adenylate cyclase